jgi:hypothetical protein
MADWIAWEMRMKKGTSHVGVGRSQQDPKAILFSMVARSRKLPMIVLLTIAEAELIAASLDTALREAKEAGK